MDNRAVALKLLLDHLGVADISTVDRRLEVQKAVYLSQVAGVPLGYTYGWYLKGPYSPSLTRDYYGLTDDMVPAGTSLRAGAVERLNAVKELMEKQIGQLDRPKRLELLASLHYLIRESRLSVEAAKAKIGQLKPHLTAFVDDGIALLRTFKLI